MRSAEITALLRGDPQVVLWWASPVECQSALHRQGILAAPPLHEALARLDTLVASVDLVAPSVGLRDRAGRLVAVHPLRAAAALRLAAALVSSEGTPRGDGFVTLDERLRTAARAEGFLILPA
jgi:uncharacterized protein